MICAFGTLTYRHSAVPRVRLDRPAPLSLVDHVALFSICYRASLVTRTLSFYSLTVVVTIKRVGLRHAPGGCVLPVEVKSKHVVTASRFAPDILYVAVEVGNRQPLTRFMSRSLLLLRLRIGLLHLSQFRPRFLLPFWSGRAFDRFRSFSVW